MNIPLSFPQLFCFLFEFVAVVYMYPYIHLRFTFGTLSTDIIWMCSDEISHYVISSKSHGVFKHWWNGITNKSTCFRSRSFFVSWICNEMEFHWRKASQHTRTMKLCEKPSDVNVFQNLWKSLQHVCRWQVQWHVDWSFEPRRQTAKDPVADLRRSHWISPFPIDRGRQSGELLTDIKIEIQEVLTVKCCSVSKRKPDILCL